MKKRILNNNGSVLVLLIIIISVTATLGISILNISMNHYKIKKSNNELKQAFYISEDGLNKAYLRIYDLICEASVNSIKIADDYLVLYPEDYSGASNVFKNNYKMYVLSYIKNRVFDNSNPYTEVINVSNLVFVTEKLTVKVNSKYLSVLGIEKNISANIIISVPDYTKIKIGETDLISLLCFKGFEL